MFERFTDRARNVMALANQEAQRFNHEYIGTEHILLGLVKEGSGVGANVLKNLDVDLRKVRIEVEKMVKSGASQVSSGERSLGEAKERTAAMAQEMSEEEERIVELDAEIAEMQSKREEGVDKVEDANTRLNEAKGNESSVSERLDGLRSAETEARKTLEGTRQYVKDHQRTATEVEARMEKSREALTRHKISFEDIRQTIGEPAPKDTDTEDASDEMLF